MFVALPYVCLFTFFFDDRVPPRMQSFSLEPVQPVPREQTSFGPSCPFHCSILVAQLRHFIAFLIPRTILAWNSHPLRLYVLKSRLSRSVPHAGWVDWRCRPTVLEYEDSERDDAHRLDTVRDAAGANDQRIGVALFHPLGIVLVRIEPSPYLWSIFKLNPDITFIAAMPLG
ncbi:MAG: hypothetical protein H6821_05230 [Planctomycetaceae bacterium]|nr:hypothetical protein [Planctomycetaceae bacterium]